MIHKKGMGEREERGGGQRVFSVLLLGRCVGDSLGVCLFMPGTFFDASSFAKCEV
jgi:hypothetical protein